MYYDPTKHNRQSTRLKGYDYSKPGMYFITINTKSRIHYFGEIINGNMELNEKGIIARHCLLEIPDHFSQSLLDEYVVMPNHVHCILIIGDGGSEHDCSRDLDDSKDQVRTLHATSPQTQSSSEAMSDISPKPGSIPIIIRSYKSAVTRLIHRLGKDFSWQSRYHDHIFHSHREYGRISNYKK